MTTTTAPATLRTRLNVYSYDVTTPQGRADWDEFKAARKADGARIMGPVFHDNAASRADRERDNDTIKLETTHLFDNQWTASDSSGIGFRAFDWLLEAEMSHNAAMIGCPKGIRRGYYLDQTEEMRAIRAATADCGYCGKQRPMADAPAFCPSCIGSEYLTPADFPLTRLLPVASGKGKGVRAPLSSEETEERTAAWQEARREGAKTQMGAKMAKFRAATIAKAEQAAAKAIAERDGYLWLLDHDLGGLAADNAIYYSHTGRFGFGWRAALDYALACEIMGKLSDLGFPYPYDVETIQRGKLSGAVEG